MTVSSRKDFFKEHFVYMVRQLLGTRNRLANGQSDTIVSNALIESNCITARALIDFFNDKDGAKASEFTDATYSTWLNGKVPSHLVKRLSTQIAHLTMVRTDVEVQKLDGAARETIFNACGMKFRASSNI
ncbi:hypothetical protein HYPDE_26138 [Hyphomicrobium denitrificans 1NES1]|uniref:Uncharacterized protein n=1 Tax=Hyphomicrobium denitrificans 1NES1 TaxID=670307 RepID=N0B9W8_9HYPH|nr:hypothetical protein [Hyphomicrobium denitrificans]AGK56910.1 hypothetical protein HYPDE_26138 [Hyphomicrobium denitrificans 1NES1]